MLIRPIALSLSLLLATSVSAQTAAAPTDLASMTLALKQVDTSKVAEGVVEAERQSTVTAQTSGRVTHIYFRAGDAVKQGQVIMRIDPTMAQAQVAGAQAQVIEAQVAYDNAKRDYERFRELRSKNFISQAQFEGVEAQYKAAAARVRALQAGSGQASTARTYADVTAPYSGVMSALHVELGETANPGMPLATGYDPAWLRATAQVPQAWLSAVRNGGKAMIEIAGQDAWLPAKSVAVVPAADPRTHTTEVRVYLPDDVTGLLPGQFVRLHFVTGSAQRLVVPASAVLRRSELTAVYVLSTDGHRPQMRQVRLGERQADGSYEILAGLRAGERIALNPLQAAMQP